MKIENIDYFEGLKAHGRSTESAHHSMTLFFNHEYEVYKKYNREAVHDTSNVEDTRQEV